VPKSQREDAHVQTVTKLNVEQISTTLATVQLHAVIGLSSRRALMRITN
jgi:hypothetical protein